MQQVRGYAYLATYEQDKNNKNNTASEQFVNFTSVRALQSLICISIL